MSSTTAPRPGDEDVYDDDASTSALTDSRVLEELGDLSEITWGCLHELSRALKVPDADLQGTLAAILELATTTIGGCDAAGLNVFEKGKFIPQVVRGAAPPRLDELQQTTGSGPCIEASREQVVVDIQDMTATNRWPQFARLAVELGVGSMLCLPLWINDRRLGSLSLYGSVQRAFDDQVPKRMALLLSTHAALALADAQRTDKLHRAAMSRDIIGQAKGILMERHRITAEAAFAMLVDASQDTNRKVVAIAEAIATTGQLPT